jgi:hypothetical protein
LARFTFLFGSPQLRGHEVGLLVTAYGTLIRLTRPTVLRYAWSAIPTVPQWYVLLPVRCLIGFRMSAPGNRFRRKQSFHVIECSFT